MAALFTLSAAHAAFARDPKGLWFTEDKGGVVQVRACGDSLCGVIVGLTPSPNGDMPRDFQGGPQCQRILLRDLHLHGDARWHGTVTNPEDGRSYDAEVWVGEDGDMRLRGYVGVPLLGSTQVWPPFEGRLARDCRFR